jgi:hypothetical protein
MAIALEAIGISTRHGRWTCSTPASPCRSSGAASSSRSHPTRHTGNATGAKDSMLTWTPSSSAIPAISRFELVPMSVTEPTNVVA